MRRKNRRMIANKRAFFVHIANKEMKQKKTETFNFETLQKKVILLMLKI